MSRKLKLPKWSEEPKCNTSIRASSRTVEAVGEVRQALIAHMANNPKDQSPGFPNDFNTDACINLLCRLFARDYGLSPEGVTT